MSSKRNDFETTDPNSKRIRCENTVKSKINTDYDRYHILSMSETQTGGNLNRAIESFDEYQNTQKTCVREQLIDFPRFQPPNDVQLEALAEILDSNRIPAYAKN